MQIVHYLQKVEGQANHRCTPAAPLGDIVVFRARRSFRGCHGCPPVTQKLGSKTKVAGTFGHLANLPELDEPLWATIELDQGISHAAARRLAWLKLLYYASLVPKRVDRQMHTITIRDGKDGTRT